MAHWSKSVTMKAGEIGISIIYAYLSQMCCKTSTSSANAAGFVLVGESVPARVRGKFMLLMASATMYVQFVICGKILCIFIEK